KHIIEQRERDVMHWNRDVAWQGQETAMQTAREQALEVQGLQEQLVQLEVQSAEKVGELGSLSNIMVLQVEMEVVWRQEE
ncbi:hypothetical protein C0989_007151, partial [Termitomyces sp. Mn162]